MRPLPYPTMKYLKQCIVFAGAEDMLSNWHPANFVHIDTVYKSAEQFVLYQKALFFGDAAVADRILRTKGVAEMRALGRRIKRCDEVAWRRACESILLSGLKAKFLQNPAMRTTLLATGDAELVCADQTDLVCGAGLPEDDPRITDKSAWRGLNLAGLALMRVRAELREAMQPRTLTT